MFRRFINISKNAIAKSKCSNSVYKYSLCRPCIRPVIPNKTKGDIEMAPLRALAVLSLLSYCILAITVLPLTLTLPQLYKNFTPSAEGSHGLISSIVPSLGKSPVRNFLRGDIKRSNTIYASQDSFVRGSIDAGVQHQHLEIRPENVWLMILTQMNFYLRKYGNNKEIRDKFVNLQHDNGPFHVMMFFQPEIPFEILIRQRNRTDWLIDWIQPKFTTSTKIDDVTAYLLMMASSTPTSEEVAFLTCEARIPSITLLGTQNDWELLLLKLNRLREFGVESAMYSNNLRPILSRFVATFQDPNNHDIRQF